MPAWFYDLHVLAALGLIYVFFTLVGVAGYFLNKKYFAQSGNQQIINIAQQTSLTFGTLFMAFWIALNWQTLGDLNLASKSEAQNILNLYNSTNVMDNREAAIKIQQAIDAYLSSVINEEYHSLASGVTNPKTETIFNWLNKAVYTAPSHSLQDKLAYRQVSASLNDLAVSRLKRLDYVDGQMNGVLLVFFAILLFLICFWAGFVSDLSRKLTFAVLCSQYLIILSSAWLILEIDRPFQGYFKVDNSSFIKVQQEIKLLKF